MIYTVENFYTDYELECVWKELEFYSSLPKEHRERAETTDVAKDDKGNSLGNSYRVYINQTFTETGSKYSHINNLSQKLKDHQEGIELTLPNGRQFKDMNTVYNMLSYYGPDDYYDTHYDMFQFTCLIWLFKEPKKFTGGNIYFEDLNKHIGIKNNRMIIFPSYLLHKVEKIKMNEKDFEDGFGRYTITHFLTYNGV